MQSNSINSQTAGLTEAQPKQGGADMERQRWESSAFAHLFDSKLTSFGHQHSAPSERAPVVATMTVPENQEPALNVIRAVALPEQEIEERAVVPSARMQRSLEAGSTPLGGNYTALSMSSSPTRASDSAFEDSTIDSPRSNNMPSVFSSGSLPDAMVMGAMTEQGVQIYIRDFRLDPNETKLLFARVKRELSWLGIALDAMIINGRRFGSLQADEVVI